MGRPSGAAGKATAAKQSRSVVEAELSWTEDIASLLRQLRHFLVESSWRHLQEYHIDYEQTLQDATVSVGIYTTT